MTRNFRHKNVPYTSQWGRKELNEDIINNSIDPCDDVTWKNSGFNEKCDYKFWSRRICGIACLESILSYANIRFDNRRKLILRAINWGAYEVPRKGVVNGLIYEPFCRWISNEFDIKSEIYKNNDLLEIIDKISESHMIISSVSTEIRTPHLPNFRRGGHLILLHGIEGNDIYFHNPSGIPPFQQDAHLSVEHMERFHARRGIIIEIPRN
ncbi:C39 family peptidase [Pandoraea sp. ISTKB]|uniref:C39 family peptidase n=1 Tax=Pandoraea sp. ISTKB TaxID=1586708 RepID=UPI0009F72ABA|nr:C39 family peptidase [Pandoraea sp. ISTKB]